MFSHALHEIFGSKTMFVAGGGFVIWGAILFGMMAHEGTATVVSVAF